MANQGMTFDSAPVSQPVTIPTVPSTQPGNAEMTFDASPVAQPVTVTAPSSQTQPATPTASIYATPQPSNLAARAERWAGNVAYDLEHGTNLTGVGSVLKSMGAHGFDAGVSPEAAQFMGSLPLGLLKATQGVAEIPQSGKHGRGIRDVASGLLESSTIPASFAAPEAGDVAASGLDHAGDAIASQASRAANAVKGKVSLISVQPELQQSIRNVLNKVAADAGINQPIDGATLRKMFNGESAPPSSIRDVATNLATALKSKASALYKQLDQAVGGTRFQTWDEQINNVKRALRNSAGIDPDADGRLVERINALEDAKAAALEQAKKAGVDPKLIDKANAAWKQASALEDFSHHLQASTAGMRPELAAGEKTNLETLSTAKLFPRINALWNSGRLQQALGEDKATDLLQAVDAAHLRTLKIKAAQRFAKTAAKYGAYAAGLGYAGHEALRHWFGD